MKYLRRAATYGLWWNHYHQGRVDYTPLGGGAYEYRRTRSWNLHAELNLNHWLLGFRLDPPWSPDFASQQVGIAIFLGPLSFRVMVSVDV